MIVLENISKIYKHDDTVTVALDKVSLGIARNEFVAIVGESGSGKSTLLNIIGCMDVASEGEYYLNGRLVSGMSENELSQVRLHEVTFVFQNFALLDKYTGYENIELPLVNQGVSRQERKKQVEAVTKSLNIENQLKKLPKQMSGGQQQRVALARALVSGADIILADEPTGALDSETSNDFILELEKLHEQGKTIILVTHNADLAARAERLIRISDGRIVEE